MTGFTKDINEIMEILPHRYPFLLIDKVEEIKPDESAVGVKNITINEDCFNGHFPGKPVFPGVLIIEAMAQTSIILAVSSTEEANDKLFFFTSIDEAKFRKQVIPGDVLKLHVKIVKRRKSIWKMECFATVDGQTVAEAKIGAIGTDK